MNPKQTAEQAALELYPIEMVPIFTNKDLTDKNKERRRIFLEGASWEKAQNEWKTVDEETPPIHLEILVQSPTGITHLSSWREAYGIFCCQEKTESTDDWKWKEI
jgi:hypothetical protein